MFWRYGYGPQAPPPASPPSGYYYAHPMMMYTGGNTVWTWIFGILMITCWIVFIFLMVALARWLWFKGNKERRGAK